MNLLEFILKLNSDGKDVTFKTSEFHEKIVIELSKTEHFRNCKSQVEIHKSENENTNFSKEEIVLHNLKIADQRLINQYVKR